MSKFYVSLEGIGDELLEFLGYRLLELNAEFKIYIDYREDLHIVQIKNPYMFIEDYNDARILKDRRQIALPKIT